MLTTVRPSPTGQDYDGSPLYDCWVCRRLVHKYQLSKKDGEITDVCKLCDKEAKCLLK